MTPRPNVVFILTDDHAAHSIGCYGSVVNETLNAAMWREQARLGDAPHPSQPVPAGCEDVPVAGQPELDRRSWLDPGPMGVA